jgi:hypothetical protein
LVVVLGADFTDTVDWAIHSGKPSNHILLFGSEVIKRCMYPCVFSFGGIMQAVALALAGSCFAMTIFLRFNALLSAV